MGSPKEFPWIPRTKGFGGNPWKFDFSRISRTIPISDFGVPIFGFLEGNEVDMLGGADTFPNLTLKKNISKRSLELHLNCALSGPMSRDIAILSLRYPLSRDTFSGRLVAIPPGNLASHKTPVRYPILQHIARQLCNTVTIKQERVLQYHGYNYHAMWKVLLLGLSESEIVLELSHYNFTLGWLKGVFPRGCF